MSGLQRARLVTWQIEFAWRNRHNTKFNTNKMEDFNITKEGIVIIQWLKDTDPQLGEELYNTIKVKERERDNYFVKYYKTRTVDEFKKVLQELIDTTSQGTLFTLHIVTHGYEDGLGLEILANEIKWAELFTYTRQLNEIMGNNLLLVLSSCVGGGILSCLQPEQHAPYRAIIANTREVFMKDAINGFHAFYSKYYNILDFEKGIKALNNAIDFSEEIESGKKKVEFFIMSAEQSFDEVFNPDRDPVFFKSIVDKILPPNKIIPQELRVQKAKELFKKKGKELKPHFMFMD